MKIKEFTDKCLEDLALNLIGTLKLPKITYKAIILLEPNKFEGHTRISKIGNEAKIIITISVSTNILEKTTIGAIRIILAHELSHVINPFNPDVAMKLYFPLEWKVWSKVKAIDSKALECEAKITELKRK